MKRRGAKPAKEYIEDIKLSNFNVTIWYPGTRTICSSRNCQVEASIFLSWERWHGWGLYIPLYRKRESLNHTSKMQVPRGTEPSSWGWGCCICFCPALDQCSSPRWPADRHLSDIPVLCLRPEDGCSHCREQGWAWGRGPCSTQPLATTDLENRWSLQATHLRHCGSEFGFIFF